jgi:WD40 repeat protein
MVVLLSDALLAGLALYVLGTGLTAGRVKAVRLSPDGVFLVSGGDDKTVRASDTATGDLLWRLTARRVGIFGYRFERS